MLYLKYFRVVFGFSLNFLFGLVLFKSVIFNFLRGDFGYVCFVVVLVFFWMLFRGILMVLGVVGRLSGGVCEDSLYKL